MSWFLEDSKGEYLGDFATHGGIRVMLRGPYPALHRLIKTELADRTLCDQIIEELSGDKDLAYVRSMLQQGIPPVRLTDGVESE